MELPERPPRSHSHAEDGGRPVTNASMQSGRSARSCTSSRRSRGSSAISITSSATRDDYMRMPPRNRHWYPYETGTLHQAGRYSVAGLPGYTGYVPGKVAENVHGSTFQMDNEKATYQVDSRRYGLGEMARERTPGPAHGTEIPGYMGFVPGRYSENVFGQSGPRGAETAWLVKGREKDERLARVATYRRGERPATGGADYSGYRSFGVRPGVDSRFHD